MKKRNFLLLSSCVLFSLVLSGCKSVPVVSGRQPKALELLDNGSSFYIAIPKAADQELIERIITNNVRNISDQDVKLISSHVEKVYCGLNRRKNYVEIQSAIDASVPVKMVPKILKEKNGWRKITYAPQDGGREYQIYDYQGLSLSFPSAEICCIGRGMDFMIDKFDSISALPPDDETTCFEVPPELYDYLDGAEDEIRFFANKPQSFLTILTGTQLNLNLVDVKGSFLSDPNFPTQYILTLHFTFKSEKMLKAGRTLLMLAFGLTSSQAGEDSGTSLTISGIKLDKQQLYKLLVL